MWGEIRGYVTLFVVIPLVFGGLYYGVHFAITGEWPDPPRSDCFTEWDGVSNPSVCD